MNAFGVEIVDHAVPVSPLAMQLVSEGVESLWKRMVIANPDANSRPLLLSYDVHPSPDGLVLIEINTNAGGVLTAIKAARTGNECCADAEQGLLEARLLGLFRADLLGRSPEETGTVAIIDDRLSEQPLLAEMQALAELIQPLAKDVLVIDAKDVEYSSGRLRYAGVAIDRVYWRSTDFLLASPEHSGIKQAVSEGITILAPSPEAYNAIADKRLLVDMSKQPELARDERTGLSFRIAETRFMSECSVDYWWENRRSQVFKPASGYASRGVYVGKSISRRKLESLTDQNYLAQRYAPHPVIDRQGRNWKYDVRFFADRGQIIGAAARVFHGQVVGMREPGSGFAAITVGDACCLIGALAKAKNLDVASVCP